MAISHHLKILSSVSVVNDFHLLFLKTCQSFLLWQEIIQHEKNHLKSQFTKQLEMKGVLFFSNNSCTSHDSRIGDYSFCEAVKDDVAESEVKHFKNQLLSRKNQLSITMSLLHILFGNLGYAIKLHEECADNVIEQRSLDPRKYCFNGQEEGDDCNYFLFGQGIINDFNGAEKEYLKLYESRCLFICREFYKNLVAIWLNSAWGHMEKRQTSQSGFASSLIWTSMTEYMLI
jgi:hypothetical protein